MSSEDKWLVKRRHYSGGETVVSFNMTEEDAKRDADMFNKMYQTYNYYAEKFDLQKLHWPSADDLIDIMD